MKCLFKYAVFFFTLFILADAVSALSETTAIRGGAKAYYPPKINVFEPFKVKIVFTDENLIDNLESLSITDCGIPFEVAMGLKESELELSGIQYKYNKKKEVEIWLSAISGGKLDMIGIEGEWKPRGCDISFNGKNITGQNYIGLDIEYYPYSFGVKDLPDDFAIAKQDDRDLWIRYERKGSDEISLLMSLTTFRNGNEFYTFDELKTDTAPGHGLSSDIPREQLTLNGKPTIFWHSCDTHKRSIDGLYGGNCRLYASILMPVGPVWLEMDAKLKEFVESEAEMLGIIENWKSIFLDAVASVYFESQGKNADFVIEDESDAFCGDCKQGFVCGACGKCIKEADAINPSQVDFSLDIDIKNDNEKILNAIDSNLAITVYPNLEITHNGKRVDYCSLKDPGLEMKIIGRLVSNESYSGFTSGFPTDEREKYSECEVDLKESKPKCVFIVSPSDRKKFFEDALDIVQEYEFEVIVGDKKIMEKAKLTLVPPKRFELDLKSRGTQVQQGHNTVLEVTPKGGTTDNIIVKASLLGPGKIGLSSEEIDMEWVLKSVRNGDTLKIGYAAPPMGNFDIGNELASLSMVDLQKKAAEQIAIDAVTAYGGQYVQDVEVMVDAGKFSSKIGHLTDTFKVVNGVRNIIGVDKAITDTSGELGDAMGLNEGKKGATWSERAADVGIVGISAAQTAVGVLTFVPNQIPGVEKLTAGFQTAFSAATNVWKANLQYISKSEKIERAQELFYPSVIVVTAQDLSGWTIQDMHVFKIAYHEIE